MITRDQHGSIVNFFIVDGIPVYVLADISHLIKNVRTALCSRDFVLSEETVQKYQLPTNIVSVEHVRNLHDFDNGVNGSHGRIHKLAPHLTADCFPDKHSHFKKMKVKPATALLSREVANGIYYMINHALIMIPWLKLLPGLLKMLPNGMK